YQHVDGTSFAAPIVSSIVAQMLEANPALTPAEVKTLLIATAERIEGAPAERQGFGVVHARRAVEAAGEGSARHDAADESQISPRVENGRVIFLYRDDQARRVCLAGDFNGWDGQSARYERQPDGTWRVSIQAPAAGRYRYKLLVDGVHWRDDPANASRDVDPFGGFDSILTI
ncbi:MAG: S8 family serine peptidase, partial [Acidobacteriota bacterium]|nr:S8 family serine peptidase [Acidobacteriota bacterium]